MLEVIEISQYIRVIRVPQMSQLIIANFDRRSFVLDLDHFHRFPLIIVNKKANFFAKIGELFIKETNI